MHALELQDCHAFGGLRSYQARFVAGEVEPMVPPYACQRLLELLEF
ncbi:MAG TPA: hypothetical protein VG963_09400 [Polyangiaceae bacterium]|nr:hypothetical protein [Polyangiaceae bacterium]